MRPCNSNLPGRRRPSSSWGRGAVLSDFEHLSDSQLDNEIGRSEEAPVWINPRSVSGPSPPFHAGDDSDLGKSVTFAPPPLPAGDDSDPGDDDPDLPHSWWTDDGGRLIIYPVAKTHLLDVNPDSQSSDLPVVVAGSYLAASRDAVIPAELKDTDSLLSDSEALTLCAEILKRPLSNSAEGMAEKAKRINHILDLEED